MDVQDKQRLSDVELRAFLDGLFSKGVENPESAISCEDVRLELRDGK
jgi:hypothetical protein